MKKTYLLTAVLILFIINQGLGQYESVFGQESTEWNYLSLACDAGPTSTLTVSRDTLVEDIEYKIIVKEGNSEINDLGLLRESEDRSKVWFRDFDGSDEILIMDLDLTLADKFLIGEEEYAIDSIYVDAFNRKVIEIDLILNWCGPEFTFVFTEGVGPNLGFDYIATPDFSFFMSILSCHTKDGITENFLDQFIDECVPTLLSSKNTNIKELEIYPNPSVGHLIIDLPVISTGSLYVKELTGKVVLEMKIEYSDEVNFQLNDYQSGMYLVEVVSESGERYVERVVFY